MAEPIKTILGAEAVRWLADNFAAVYPGFDRRAFMAAGIAGLDRLALKERAAHIAAAMQAHLPVDFPEAARIVAAALGPPVPATGENGPGVLRYMPHDAFIEHCGLDHPDAAFQLMAEVTRRASCEFSIRAFILRHPEPTYRQLLAWAVNPDAHLRRLASEGSRPRLPWALRLRDYQRDPAPVIAILEHLKDDPALYVRRSVANSIGDIGKDHPDLAVALCRGWLVAAGPERRWLVRHALRDLVKKANPGALALFGVGDAPEVRVDNLRLKPPRSVTIGGRLDFSVDVVSTSHSTQELLADFVVHFVKASGRTSPKVFKLRRFALAAGERLTLSGTVSFADLTTRRHYPGRHGLDLQVNGRSIELARFEVRR